MGCVLSENVRRRQPYRVKPRAYLTWYPLTVPLLCEDYKNKARIGDASQEYSPRFPPLTGLWFPETAEVFSGWLVTFSRFLFCKLVQFPHEPMSGAGRQGSEHYLLSSIFLLTVLLCWSNDCFFCNTLWLVPDRSRNMFFSHPFLWRYLAFCLHTQRVCVTCVAVSSRTSIRKILKKKIFLWYQPY